MSFLIVWVFAIVPLSPSLSHAGKIVGHWETESRTGNDIYFFFGSEGDFFIENKTSWIQGTYIVETDSVPGQVDLYVQDGSNVEDIGKKAHYGYNIHDNILTLSGTPYEKGDRLSTLDTADPSGSFVYIGINDDPRDEDDDKDINDQDNDWVVYANCFVEILSGIHISP